MSAIHLMAEEHGDHDAVVIGDGELELSYADLERRSRRLANLLRKLGAEPGDGVVLLMGNEEWFFDVFWAAMRTGLYFTPINWHLQREEIRYIVDNCDAKFFITSGRFAEVAADVARTATKVEHKLAFGGAVEGFRSAEDALAEIPEDAPLVDGIEGALMLYSSGTTGYPKGVRQPLTKLPAGDPAATIAYRGLGMIFGITPEDRYLSPAPLYHAAPLIFTTTMHRFGASVVVMPTFDAEAALRLIEREKITVSQWVPTHFTRLLQLPAQVRNRYDLSTHRMGIHAAAPCPIPIKEQMIEWWGPIVTEYYGGTEGGGTIIHASDWMTHKGSVGRHWAGGAVHILDEEGNEVTEAGAEGGIYFEGAEKAEARFRYYKDDEKTAGTYRGRLFTLGDVGYLDQDGFLYLTDRKSHMIISGGVNIYPQEVENHLASHPNVDDVAVIGVPNEEMGEEVKAVVIPRNAEAGPGLERTLIEFCRDAIAHYKCPRSIDFVTELPRLPNGKLLKRELRQRYWKDAGGRRI